METKKLYEVLVALVHEDKEYEVGSQIELYEDEAMAFGESVKVIAEAVKTEDMPKDDSNEPQVPVNEDGSKPEDTGVTPPPANDEAPKAEVTAETTAEEKKEEGWAGNHTVGKE